MSALGLQWESCPRRLNPLVVWPPLISSIQPQAGYIATLHNRCVSFVDAVLSKVAL